METIQKYLSRIKSDRRRRRRGMSFILALSLMVTGGVSWQLHGIGTAMSDTAAPNARGHTHSEECFEKVLVCQSQEEGHVHTDECFEEKLVCGTEAASPETPAQWECTLPETLTGIWRNDAAAVAESQLGYRENGAVFTAAEDGQKHGGYTRYGEWYGNPCGEWNTMFVYFCMHYAGIPEESIPYGSGCWAWSLKLEENGLLTEPGETLPQRGDILLYDDDTDGKADRSGIVTGVTMDNGDTEIETIEGNVNGEVAGCSHSADDEKIIGYLLLAQEDAEPATEACTGQETGTAPEDAEDTGPGDNEAPVGFTGVSESGITVAVNAPAGAFPEDTAMTVSDVPDDEASRTAAGSYGMDPGAVNAVAVDITFTAPDGTELEPAGDEPVQVTITLPEDRRLAGEEFGLLHVEDSGEIMCLGDAEVSAGGASFETMSFSVYIVMEKGDDKADFTIWYDGAFPSDNPLIAYKGQTIALSQSMTREEYEQRKAQNGGWLEFTLYQGNDICSSDAWGTVETYMQQTGPDQYTEMVRVTRRFTFNDTGTVIFNLIGSDFKINVNVVRSNVQVMGTDGVYRDINFDMNERYGYNPYQGKPDEVFYAIEGDEIKLIVDGYNDWQTQTENNGVLTKQPVSYENEDTYVTFTATGHGDTYINADGTIINVHVDHPLYVKTALQDRDFDRVNEWLPDVYINEKRNGYIPNILDNDGHFHPYHMSVGDTLDLYTLLGDTSNLQLYVQGLNMSYIPWDAPGGYGYDKYTYHGTTENDILQTITYNPNDNGTLSAQYQAVKPGYAQILLIDGQNVIRKMYIEVGKEQGKLLDHADIEIADGGKYTSTNISIKSDGTVEKKVTIYDSYVDNVNSCVLYDRDDPTKPCQFYRNENDPYSPEENVTGYLTDDYWKDPTIAPGEPQFELTSKYKKDQYGNITEYSNIKYYFDEVDHAVFDVQLMLYPEKEMTYVKSGDSWVLTGTTDLTGNESRHIDSALFYMEHQDVVDALNKCPNHTGLDFTIMASSAMIEFEVAKIIPGMEIHPGDFTFEVYDDSGKTISIASNDEDGIVVFDGIHFEKPGDYSYHIREIDDGKFENVIYNTEPLDITIRVTELDVQTGEMYAEIISPDDLDFTIENYREYRLPETGGTGTLPYTLCGTAFLSTALLLFLRRRKLSQGSMDKQR